MLYPHLALSALIIVLLLTSITTTTMAEEFVMIAGYQPQSQVTDHAAIDLDQRVIEKYLEDDIMDNGKFEAAQNVYNQGGYSKSYAEVKVTTPEGGLPSFVEKGTIMKAAAILTGIEVQGSALTDFPAGSKILRFQYDNTQASGVCQVGQLLEEDRNTVGCIQENGTIRIQNQDSVEYSYDYTINNDNARTIAAFSTGARTTMHDCDECPYDTYDLFVDYYDEFDYGNQWITAAFDQDETDFPLGNGDFSEYDNKGRAEIIQIGTVTLNVWMYVIREMEDALEDCIKGALDRNDNSVNAWDEAVAFYVGSLEATTDGTTGNKDTNGKLLYTLANKQCANFRTCGEGNNEVSGNSAINIYIMRAFEAGQGDLMTGGGQCDAARRRKEEIEKLMVVPLIQGTLNAAYSRDYDLLTTGDGRDKADAEGAAFAASVLPLVHACNKNDAQIIYDNMRAGLYDSDFLAVKAAFEANYRCMGVSCKEVGGLWVEENGSKTVYRDNASPCNDVTTVDNTAAIVGIVLGGLCVFLILVIVYMKVSRRNDQDNSFVAAGDEHIDPVPPPAAFKVGGGELPEQSLML